MRQRYNPYGGAERFVARALPALERAGMQVTLMARKQQGWGARRFLRVDPFHAGNLWRDWSFARAARKAWRREHYDIVQSHERIPGCDVYRAGDGVHRRWLELRRAAAGQRERLSIALNPYHAYVCRAEKAMLEHPRLRAVICNSRMVRDEIQRGFRIAPEKLHVIYNGIDLQHFHPQQREKLRGAARAEIGCSPRDTLFVFVGSGFSRKGLDAAIQAVSRGPHWLVIVGKDRVPANPESTHQIPRWPRRRAALLRRSGLLHPAEPLRSLSQYRAGSDGDGIAGNRELALRRRRGDRARRERLDLPARRRARDRAPDAGSRAHGRHRPPHGRAARATAERFGIDAMARQLVDLYASLKNLG